tara:strand:- start:3581 stop:4552 length:972 start_codon:yes stop_codon:yes gene_type:complete
MSLKKYLSSNFDFDVSGLAAYVDEQSQELLVKQVTAGKTLEQITIQEGVKGSAEIKLMDDSLVYQAGDCTMTASGDTVFTDRAISVETLGYMKKFCQKDLAGFWTQLNLRAGAMAEDEELPFEALIIEYIQTLQSNELDKLIWRGNKSTGTGNLAFMNGFRSILTTGAGCVNLNTSSTASITNANAYDVFYEVFENSPEAVAESADFKCFTGRENFNKLIKNLVDLNFFHYSPEQIASMDSVVVPGTDMVVSKVVGLNTLDNIYTGRASHFIFGTDLTGDLDQFELWYSKDDDVLYMRSKFRAGVQVPYLDQIGVWNGTGSPN